jgi:hypothetical protein
VVVGNRFMNGEARGAWLSQATGVAERVEGEALSVRSVPRSGVRGGRCFCLNRVSGTVSPIVGKTVGPVNICNLLPNVSRLFENQN